VNVELNLLLMILDEYDVPYGEIVDCVIPSTFYDSERQKWRKLFYIADPGSGGIVTIIGGQKNHFFDFAKPNSDLEDWVLKIRNIGEAYEAGEVTDAFSLEVVRFLRRSS